MLRLWFHDDSCKLRLLFANFGRHDPVLQYHAAYFDTDEGWIIAEVLDFPGALSQGRTLQSARRMIRDALKTLAETYVEEGTPLPRPNPRARNKKAIFTELLQLGVRVPMESGS